MREIEFWFSIGSTYTYLSVERLPEISIEHNINFIWKPFSVRQIMIEMENVPFTPPPKKNKSNYMWRDIERRSKLYGIKSKVPAPYPLKEFDRANQVGILLNSQGKYLEYIEETYRIWFLEGLEAGSEENLRKCLSKMSLHFDEIVTRANDAEVIAAYEANTSEAHQLGIFGAPSFTIGNEIFWGDDRLEDAVRFLEGT